MIGGENLMYVVHSVYFVSSPELHRATKCEQHPRCRFLFVFIFTVFFFFSRLSFSLSSLTVGRPSVRSCSLVEKNVLYVHICILLLAKESAFCHQLCMHVLSSLLSQTNALDLSSPRNIVSYLSFVCLSACFCSVALHRLRAFQITRLRIIKCLFQIMWIYYVYNAYIPIAFQKASDVIHLYSLLCIY